MKVERDRQAQVTDAMVTDTLAAYGLTPANWEQVEEGIGNVVVLATDAEDGNEYYIKFYKTTSTRDIVEREVAFTRSLNTRGIPVAQYVPRLDGGFVYGVPHPTGTNYVTVTHKVAGEHPTRYTARLTSDFARQHAELHRVGTEWHEGRVFKHHEYYHYLPAGPNDTALQDLEKALAPVIARVDEAWEILPQGLVHLDIDRDNLLAIDDVVTGLIDFDDLSLAPLAFCLAGTLWDVIESGGSVEDVRAYLARYETIRPLTPAEHAILPDMILMRGWVALHAAFFGHGRTAAVSERTLALLAQACMDGLANVVTGHIVVER